MVKLLEKTATEIDLRKIGTLNHTSYEGITNDKLYSCDCDTFGGGDPPCDCNR